MKDVGEILEMPPSHNPKVSLSMESFMTVLTIPCWGNPAGKWRVWGELSETRVPHDIYPHAVDAEAPPPPPPPNANAIANAVANASAIAIDVNVSHPVNDTT